MKKLIKIDIVVRDNFDGREERQAFSIYSSGIGPEPLDAFCQVVVREGIVDEIHYTKSFSLVSETTKALEGKR